MAGRPRCEHIIKGLNRPAAVIIVKGETLKLGKENFRGFVLDLHWADKRI